MGLDVYLYRAHDDIEKWERIAKKAEAETERLWEKVGGYAKASEADKKRIRAESKEVYAKRGLDDYGDIPDSVEEKIEINSKVHPEHMFKVGYLRSSYNEGGINHILREYLGGKDLYYVFGGEDRDGYRVQPDWAACLVRAREVRGALTVYAKQRGNYELVEFGFNSLSTLKDQTYATKEEAIADVRKNVERYAAEDPKKRDMFGPWSSSLRSFNTPNGMKLLGACWGRRDGLGRILGGNEDPEPCLWLVYETEKPPLQWYEHAMEITCEMIEWVLSQPDPKSYLLHWSG